jgi:tetratricopeptide (TPR) repeat protein
MRPMSCRLDGSAGRRRAVFLRAPFVVLLLLRAWPHAVAAVAMIAAATTAARADDASVKSRRGQALAAQGNCVAAVPLLEEAELGAHRPAAALALGDCYVALGELLKASETFRALADEKPARTHTYADRMAIRKARARLAKVDERIPTLAFELAEPYDDLEVFVNGEKLDDPTRPKKVEPNVAVRIVARARGRAELQDTVQLGEGERAVRPLRLALPAPKPPKNGRPPHRENRKKRPRDERPWLGVMFRGHLVPRPVMEMFGDGGKTVLFPGGSVVYSVPSSEPRIHLTLGYANYQIGSMPFKPKDTPDTDYEIIESTLEAGYATVEVMWEEPLDDAATWRFSYGFGVGIGLMFRGGLYRTQAYPPGMVPGNPDTYRKCDGPNRPPGSWSYCNSLDFDSDHYNYDEPTWAQGGKRPLIYPWLGAPLLGISTRLGRDMMLDLQTGLTDSGILLQLGARAGL